MAQNVMKAYLAFLIDKVTAIGIRTLHLQIINKFTLVVTTSSVELIFSHGYFWNTLNCKTLSKTNRKTQN